MSPCTKLVVVSMLHSLKLFTMKYSQSFVMRKQLLLHIAIVEVLFPCIYSLYSIYTLYTL